MREFGPSVLDRLAQSARDRELMIQRARESWAQNQVTQILSSDSPRHPQRGWRRAYLGLASSISLALAACSGGGQPDRNHIATPTLAPLKDDFDLPFSGTWYLTSGPHSDGLSQGRRYALDFAPPEVVACPGGKPLEGRYAEASASGTVTVVGNEKDPTDKNHSIVEIQHSEGFTTGYTHLDNIKVRVGQEVKLGDSLGNPSCEYPPGGRNTGEHLHFYVKKDGLPTNIKNIKLSGYQIIEGSSDGAGYLSKPGEEMRTNNEGRCDTDSKCKGIRNDVTHDTYQTAINSGIDRLKNGTSWGEVWNDIKAKYPNKRNEEIDQALGVQWREPGAYERYKGEQAAAKPTMAPKPVEKPMIVPKTLTPAPVAPNPTRIPVPTSIALSKPTQAPLPRLEQGFTTFTSALLPYRINYPQGWIRSVGTLNNMKADVFTDKLFDYTTPFSRISIAREQTSPWISSEDYGNNYLNPIKQSQYTNLGLRGAILKPYLRNIGGIVATGLIIDMTNNQPPTQDILVVFKRKDSGWIIQLNSVGGKERSEGQRYLKQTESILEKIIESVHFLD